MKKLSRPAHMGSMDNKEKAEHLRAGRWAYGQLETLEGVISYMEATTEESWRVKTVRSEDGTTNCFFGHLFSMGSSDAEGSALWNAFEELWATTYRIYPINDGENPSYPQETPKQRILAFLNDLRDGKVMNTEQSMEACYQFSLAAEAEEQARMTAVAAVPA